MKIKKIFKILMYFAPTSVTIAVCCDISKKKPVFVSEDRKAVSKEVEKTIKNLKIYQEYNCSEENMKNESTVNIKTCIEVARFIMDLQERKISLLEGKNTFERSLLQESTKSDEFFRVQAGKKITK